MTAQPSSPFDMSPMLKVYADSIELWKKNYEGMLRSTPDRQDTGTNGADGNVVKMNPSADGGATPYNAVLLKWNKSAGSIFKQFVQNQVELCHFFGNRWEQYLKLPEQLSQCRTLSELGTLQTSFLSQLASDYMNESKKLTKPVADLATNWPAAKAS